MVSRNFVKGLRRTALTTALSMCLAGSLMAAETGGLRITITSSDGAPVPGATVEVSSPDSLVSKTAVTAADGTVRLRGLDPATNYSVSVNASGYKNITADNVAVVTGKSLSLGYVIGATQLDTVVVTGRSLAAVDTTSASVGTTLTLDTVESLPTGRSYQSYLQLVPAVKPSPTGNPASKSGVNYANIDGVIGQSTDNVYYIDGVNVTDPTAGTFGTNLNSEIIQEQQVLTGGIPAKYAGGTGLISRVVTKSGSNEFHGSVNYYLQNDNLVSDDKHGQSSGFSTYDTAVTLGGPIIKDKLWFFGSYQKKHRTDDVVDPVTGDALRTVDTDSHYGFFKATWQITDNDRLTGTFFNDPYERSGSTNPTTVNNRDSAREQGGNNYKLDYSHNWTNFRLDLFGYKHKAEAKTLPANSATRNDVAYRTGNPSNADLQLGGSGTTNDIWNNRRQFGFNGEYWLETDFGTHDIQFGYTDTRVQREQSVTFSGPDQAHYTSIAPQDAGATINEYFNGNWTGDRDLIASDLVRVRDAVNNSADKAYFLGILDANGDGNVSQDELLAYRLTSTQGNPNGDVNVYRIKTMQNAPYTVTSKGKAFYLQDSWTLGQWTVNAGVRTEQWGHFASNNEEIYTFEWKYAPRLSVVYDLFGDGTSKVWGFAGRYYDPVRTNMTDFAGALTGPVNAEQLFIGDRWLTYRTRGGATQRDAAFVPSIKTPYTDEFMLGYEATLAANLGLEVTATYRKTTDILEDFDISLYSDPDADPSNIGIAAPGSRFYLPISYYGYDKLPDGINYFVGTLPGAKRVYKGLTASLTKYRSNNWMGKVSYTYNDFKGNSNSDSNADFQGDWVALDPRAPHRYGPMAGNIKNQFKAYGAYYFNFGLELAGVFNWNSGYVYDTAFELYGRHLPVMVDDPYDVGGVLDTWIKPGAVGGNTAPSYYTFDVRAKYTKDFGFGDVEFFLDVFNLFDNQATTHVQDLLHGDGAYNFGQATDWVQPRRAYLGVRYSF